MHKTKMYACFTFFQNGDVKRWKYVRDLNSFGAFLDKSHSTWKYFNVYDKETKQFLKRFYPGNTIPKILGVFMLFLSVFLAQKVTPSKTFASPTTYENTFNKTTFIYGFNNTATIPKEGRKEGRVC